MRRLLARRFLRTILRIPHRRSLKIMQNLLPRQVLSLLLMGKLIRNKSVRGTVLLTTFSNVRQGTAPVSRKSCQETDDLWGSLLTPVE